MIPKIMLDARPAQGRPRGIGIYVRRLVEHLLALDQPPRLQLALDRNAGPDPWPERPDLVRVWGAAGNPVIWEQRVLPQLAAAAHVDLLHCTANASPWACSVPHLVTIHDALFLRPWYETSERLYLGQWFAHAYYRYGVGRGARRARLVLTDSETSRQELLTQLGLPAAKVRQVPLAEPYAAHPLPEEELKRTLTELQVEQPYLLGLGAIDRRKNTANLVRAFARMPRSAAPLLVLAGFEKLSRSRVPELAKFLDVAPRVKILGYLPPEKLAALFQGAALFVYPSLAEGFGLPILQAFGLGVPVVTSRTGAMQELAGTAARLADSADPRSLSQEMIAVLSDSTEAHRLAYAGYLRAKEFSWKRTAQLTCEAYQAALGA